MNEPILRTIFDITPLTWSAIGCAITSGTIIGFERQIAGKPVGIRTSILICLGTYVFVGITNSIHTTLFDPSRIIGQIVTGIGFLGAGVMLTRDGVVVGVTSASAIWILSAIGITIGSGYNFTGVKLSILAVIVLIGLDILENSVTLFQRGVHKVVSHTKVRKKFYRNKSE
jgi:putative Mg2+ transporter-C (MgtC) family protein